MKKQAFIRMRINLRADALFLALGLSTLGFTANAKRPEQYVLTPESPTALLVMKAEWWRPAPSTLTVFYLGLSTYDPVNGKATYGFLKGSSLLAARKKYLLGGYFVQTIKPGRWVFINYVQQGHWSQCFHAASLQFEVKPGEVLYLGEFDSIAHRTQLTGDVVRAGKGVVVGSDMVEFFDQASGPLFRPIDEAQLADVRSTLARLAPQITAPVRPVAYAPAQFGTGTSLFGKRQCVGYNTKSAYRQDGGASGRAESKGR